MTRARQGRAIIPARVIPPRPVPWQRAETVTAPRPPAVEAPKQELHVHLDGISAAELAEILARVNRHQD